MAGEGGEGAPQRQSQVETRPRRPDSLKVQRRPHSTTLGPGLSVRVEKGKNDRRQITMQKNTIDESRTYILVNIDTFRDSEDYRPLLCVLGPEKGFLGPK